MNQKLFTKTYDQIAGKTMPEQVYVDALMQHLAENNNFYAISLKSPLINKTKGAFGQSLYY
jgi:hypothetical protein